MYNILICDDEKDIVNALKIYLDNSEYNLLEAFDGEQALDVIENSEIHLVLLDIMMPNMDGITAMKKIREINNVPVILLTAKSEDTDKILGLNCGADDYITKPFNPIEVLARVKSNLRRYVQLGSVNKTQEGTVVGGLELNEKSKTASLDGAKLVLTPKEFQILAMFMKNLDTVFSPKEIYETIWKEPFFGGENTVAVHIRHLREKIEIDSANPRYLKVVWGQGYIMESR
ncbi:MAG: response regulator transcription factor [Clostridia bacterium]